MKKKKVLAFILAMVMMIVSVSVVQAAEIEDSEIAPASTVVTASKNVTIGVGKFRLYAYTMSFGYFGEAFIESEITSYTTTDTNSQKEINEAKKTLGVTDLLVRKINLATEELSKVVTVEEDGTYVKNKVQTENGLYVIYAVGTETFACNGGNWVAYTYHDNFPISLESNSEEENQ